MHRGLEPYAVRQARGRGRRVADRRGRAGRARRCRDQGRGGDEVVLGHYGGGFSPQGFTSSLVLQAGDAWRFAGDPRRECLRHRLGRDPPGPEVDRRGPGAFRPGGGRREDDRPARARGRQGAARRRLPQGGGRDRGRLRRRVRPDRPALLPAARRSERRSPRSPPRTTRTAAPTRWRNCARTWASSSAAMCRTRTPGRRPAQAHRLLAGLGRRRGAGADRRRDRARHEQGGGVPGRGPGQRLPADESARHHPVRGLH